MKSGDKKVLWGKEFEVVKNGLSEEQVVGFVSELMDKYRALSEQKDHFITMGTISERAAIAADKAASEIKAQAQKKAEAEAERIIAEATQKAREMVVEATKKALEVTKKETEDIIQVANQRAAIIDTETKQKTQLYLIKRRREIQDQLKEEVKKTYNQLLSALQDLMGRGQEVETEWKNKTIELWGSKVFSLDWSDVSPVSAGAETGQVVPVMKEEVVPQVADGLPVDVAEDRESAETDTTELAAPAISVDAGLPTLDVASEAISNNGGDAALEETLGISIDEDPLVEKVVAEVMEEVAEKTLAVETKEEKKEEPKRAKEEKSKADVSGMYEGEVELTIVPPVGLALLSEIHNELDKITEAKVLQTVGSWDKSTSIKVLLEKPMQLAKILTQIPGVEMDEKMTKKGNFKSSTTNPGKQGRENYIALRTSSGT
jgi:hypothetical protein